jgi:FdhE protein
MLERADPQPGWHRGYCPICGAWPLLDELRGVELARYSRCSGCGAGWRTQRLACPYCGNDDYRSLQSLAVEGEQRFRIAVCDRCHGYVKVANAFDPAPSALLALDDVASMHLDVAAIERGYHRPQGPGFTIELAVPEEEWAEELA